MVAERESITAKICAFARAWHSEYAQEKIYDDYLALKLMGKDEYNDIYKMIKNGLIDKKLLGNKETEEAIEKYFVPIPLSRIQFNENELDKFIEDNKEIQYVICGAGEDTFSFRNNNENIDIFEIDHPDTQRFKIEKIRKLGWNVPNNVRFVSVDFENEKMSEKLLKAGFNPNKKTFFSILGVSYYLELDVFAETLKQIIELSGIESKVVFDYPMKSGKFPDRVKCLEKITKSLGEKMCGGFDYNEIKCVLCSLGYKIDKYMSPQMIQNRYFDGRNDKLKAYENVSLIAADYIP